MFFKKTKVNLKDLTKNNRLLNLLSLLFLPITLTFVLPIYLFSEKRKKKKMSKVIASGIFIINKDLNVLICHPTRHAKNFWSIPKGKLDSGESLVDAAIRETYEECNIELNEYYNKLIPLPPVTYSHKKKEIRPFVLFETDCVGLDLSKFELKCNSNVPEERGGFPEMDDFKWVTIDVAELLLHETQVTCLNNIKIIIKNRLDK
jgi:8-oxo-dGTP pyrophosphatase MutT (NUDIX family)